MGTNYYVKQPGCEKDGAQGQTYHLGKSSAGWRFLFQADPSWPKSMALVKWTKLAKSGVIHDEYDQETTFKELWGFIMSKQLERSHQLVKTPAWMLDPGDFVCDGYDFCSREFS